MRVLSVDLGTSNTVAVLSAHGRSPRVVEIDGAPTMPSALFLVEDGTLIVGREAERRARLDPSRFEPNPKRRIDEGTLLLGDQVVPVTDALAAVLRRVVEETSRQLSGGRPDEVRLTHPAQWGPVRRNALLSAARQAGMGSNLVLVPEPVAAAAHFASFPDQTLAPGQALAVYDLGAGTFDVAVVGATQNGFVVLAEAGLPDLGGLDVDQALLEHVGRQASGKDPGLWQRLLRPQSTGDRRAQRALREDVKVGKESLSTHPQTDIALPEPLDDVLVGRSELEALIRPNLLRSAELLAGTIRAAGLTPDRLAGIYLVGGSSRIPLVATLIAENLHVVPVNLDQPETAVALGAHHVSQDAVSLRTSDVSNVVHEANSPMAGPTSGQFGAQQGGPQSAPMPVAQQYNPGPATPGPGFPPPQQPMQPMGQQWQPQPGPMVPHQRPSGNKTGVIAALIVVMVLAIAAVVVVIVVNKNSDKESPVATSTSNSRPSSRSSTSESESSSSDSPPSSSACTSTGTPDSGTGLTPCLEVATSQVASTGDCQSESDSSVKAAVVCYEDGPKGENMAIRYKQVAAVSDVDSGIDDELSGRDASKSDSISWSGGGHTGKYWSYPSSLDDQIILFSFDDLPVYGEMTCYDGVTADVAKQFFESNVKPQ